MIGGRESASLASAQNLIRGQFSSEELRALLPADEDLVSLLQLLLAIGKAVLVLGLEREATPRLQ